ncbi:MAG: GPW/gp25 family protein [Sphingobacteriaceae bacterium]|nr:GPW/gp25 family protein [Sphingobacteriaceae bacterium]
MIKNNPYTNYQLSTIGVGAIATGLDDVRQCIDFILRTIPGSDPLRPLFGCDIFQYADDPVTTAIPNMKLAIFEALKLWEKRIVVSKITHTTDKSNVLFNITYNVVDQDLLDTLVWSNSGIVNTGTASAGIILSATIPIKQNNGRYNVLFIVNDSPAFPMPPVIGFESATDLLTWVNYNWLNYGKWYIAGDKLIVYLTPGIATTATLSISQTVTLTIKKLIPGLSPGEFFNLQFIVDEIPALPEFPLNTLSTLEQLINWVQDNWQQYGSFTIESNGVTFNAGDFNTDFNNDFNTGGLQVSRNLIFQTTKHTSATLNFE